MSKTLLVRMDKLGDLVLCLPVDQAPVLSDTEPVWLISKGTGFIAEHSDPPRIFFEMNKNFSWTNLRRLHQWLVAEKFSAAVVFYAPWWIGLTLVLARVPVRIGRLSQWHSFFFFNRGVRQSRKGGDRHETDDNLALLQKGFQKIKTTSFSQVTGVEPLRLRAREDDVEKWGLEKRKYIVVHPGMAGSALNWPSGHYIELIKRLSELQKVVLTGTSGDRPFLLPIEQYFSEGSKNIIRLNEKLGAKDLLVVLSQARAVIAPSTGVLHLAAALGTPVVGIYSPLPVQRPSRWAPRGPRVITLTASADENSALRDPHAAMSTIRVEAVMAALEDVMK